MEKIFKPNLFIIGAMKSGTSSLHLYLDEHPEIFMSQPKEPSYFVSPDQLKNYWRGMWEKRFWENEAKYLSLFQGADRAKIIGESSTTYSKYPKLNGVARRIKEYNSSAKFIYLMRDPVERTISHYWHTVRWEKERRSPIKAIRENPHFLEVSHYAMQLKEFFSFFPMDQIHELTIEAFQKNQEKHLSSLFQWLGVDKGFIPGGLSNKDHVTPEVIHQVKGAGFLDAFRYSKVWEIFNPYFPQRLKDVARSVSDKPVHKSKVNMEEVVSFLKERQLKETEELEALLGRKFPEWKTLHG